MGPEDVHHIREEWAQIATQIRSMLEHLHEIITLHQQCLTSSQLMLLTERMHDLTTLVSRAKHLGTLVSRRN